MFRLKFKNDLISNTDLLVPSVRLPCRRFSCRFGNCENLLIEDKLNHTCHCIKVENFNLFFLYKILILYYLYREYLVQNVTHLILKNFRAQVILVMLGLNVTTIKTIICVIVLLVLKITNYF